MPRKVRRRRSQARPAKEQLKDIFSLHMSERRGALVLMSILIMLTGWVVYEQWLYTPATPDLEPLERELQEWVAKRKQLAEERRADPPVTLFEFDPNTIGREEWLRLGLTEKQTDVVLRYRATGARFKVKRDLAKVYSISEEDYQRLEPFILLPDTLSPTVRGAREGQVTERSFKPDTFTRRQPTAWTERPAREVRPLDVNEADTTELVTLPGIGPAFARGIHKYRESLGGYVSLEQLHEVYVLRDKPEAVERLKELLYVGDPRPRRIPINSATVEELAAHPYISWKVAHGLVNYRKQHGPFDSVDAIKGSVLVNEDLYRRIGPYLTVE